MDGSRLPRFSEIMGPAYRTIFRGVRIKDDIRLSHSFKGVEIDEGELRRFKMFFKFRSELPVTFLYTLAQRAQSYLMLKKEFTIQIPGMIHVSNEIEQYDGIASNKPFDIDVRCEVPKKEGSLHPKFEVEYYQDGELVAKCLSNYLAKRRSLPKFGQKKKRREPPHQIEAKKTDLWTIHKSVGKLYGEIAGDKNPIHTSRIFARLAGFKRPIVQGWYLVCRATYQIEKEQGVTTNSVTVNFHKPIFVDSNVHFRYNSSEFRISDNGNILTSGSFHIS